MATTPPGVYMTPAPLPVLGAIFTFPAMPQCLPTGSGPPHSNLSYLSLGLSHHFAGFETPIAPGTLVHSLQSSPTTTIWSSGIKLKMQHKRKQLLPN